MKILAISESFTSGGLENQIIEQREILARFGVELHLATWTAPLPTQASFGNHCLNLTSNDYPLRAGGFTSSIRKIAEYVRQNRITHIHGHPFSSILPAAAVAAECELPYILTLHGPSSAEPIDWSGGVYTWLFPRALIPCSDAVFVVSEDLSIKASTFAPPGKIITLPNGVDFSEFTPITRAIPHLSGRWAIVSRLDKDKGVGIAQFIEAAALAQIPALDIYGDGDFKSTLEAHPNLSQFPGGVTFHGMIDKPWTKLHPDTIAIAGMGRALLEGLALNLPCFLIGYGTLHGLISRSNISNALAGNLSGRGMPSFTPQQLLQSLLDYKSATTDHRLREFVKDTHDCAQIWSKYHQKLTSLNKPTSFPKLIANWISTLPADTDLHENPELLYRLSIIFENHLGQTPTPLAIDLAKRLTLPSIQAQLENLTAELTKTRADYRAQLDQLAAELTSTRTTLACRDNELTQLRAENTARIVAISEDLATTRTCLAARETELSQTKSALTLTQAQQERLHRMSKDPIITLYRKLRRTFRAWPY